MKSEVNELLDKARRSIRTAEKIFKDGEVDFAGSRAYYAMFYVAEALLLDRGLAFSVIQPSSPTLERNLPRLEY
jgi:uncharacterized protein (UPF0332 family)